MAKIVPCAGNAGKCEDKASLYVKAFGQQPWDGFYCDKHAGRIIKLRGKLVRKYNLNVVVRPITAWDRKQDKRKGRKR